MMGDMDRENPFPSHQIFVPMLPIQNARDIFFHYHE